MNGDARAETEISKVPRACGACYDGVGGHAKGVLDAQENEHDSPRGALRYTGGVSPNGNGASFPREASL